ncbi:hypothetical protein [Flavobacterium lacisediminis]|uniref:Uncharacterized protein n=1 Tax=Flavobacterium lacisediminis TaxID=2989705 RepID=A0ABT3EG53_9FLAO|nr:hypothetical protein [Flavobacterium lacisediminis]MCW1147543.1 hypothetical protein [Flavobacterium lacisediminis]
MNALIFIRQSFKDFLKDKKVEEVKYKKIIPYFSAISSNINKLELTNSILNDIKYDIINYLKYSQLDDLIESIDDDDKKEIIKKIILQENYRWYNQIEYEIKLNIKNARLSLNTSEYIAFIIGKKVELKKFNDSIFFNDIYSKLDHILNKELIAPFTLNYFEVEQKSNVPVRQALSLFFRNEKNVAIIQFKRLLNIDRESRLDSSFQAEYFEMTRIFFEKLNLDFIPLIDINNYDAPVCLSNEDGKYVTRDKIQSIIDDGDYFNQRGFIVDIKDLIRKDKIVNKEKFTRIYLIFFQNISKKVTEKHIDVLFSCFTQSNPKYDEFEIFDSRETLKKALSKKNSVHEFLSLNNDLLDTGVLDISRAKLIKLLSMYFNEVKGMGYDNIKLLMTGKKRLDS